LIVARNNHSKPTPLDSRKFVSTILENGGDLRNQLAEKILVSSYGPTLNGIEQKSPDNLKGIMKASK
jgi:hypothetical protein